MAAMSLRISPCGPAINIDKSQKEDDRGTNQDVCQSFFFKGSLISTRIGRGFHCGSYKPSLTPGDI